MIYNLKDLKDLQAFWERFKKLLFEGKVVELKEKKVKRTVRQNAYMHVLISLVAIEFGYTLDECKTMLKRECSFMIYEKNGLKFLRRTRDMDTKELTDFIEWILNFAGIHGIHLPSSEDYIINQIEIDKQIERNKHYL